MPYLTDEQRKQPLWTTAGRFIFQCAHQDLSAPVRVSPLLEYKACKDYPVQELASAIASFTAGWIYSVHQHLNGFPGMDTIKWELK